MESKPPPQLPDDPQAVVRQAKPMTRQPPIKDPNPPEAEVPNPPPEVPKVGSRDAPGG
jgi:hypothetical protein